MALKKGPLKQTNIDRSQKKIILKNTTIEVCSVEVSHFKINFGYKE